MNMQSPNIDAFNTYEINRERRKGHTWIVRNKPRFECEGEGFTLA